MITSLDISTRNRKSCVYLILTNELWLQDLFFFTHSFACSLANTKVGVREELFNLVLMKSKTRVKY